MTKKITSLILVAAFVLALLPAGMFSVFAANSKSFSISNAKADSSNLVLHATKDEPTNNSDAYGYMYYCFSDSQITAADKDIEVTAVTIASNSAVDFTVQLSSYKSEKYMYWCFKEAQIEGKTIKRSALSEYKIEDHTDTDAPSVTNCFALRDGSSSEKVTFSFTSSEAGKIYISTSAISTENKGDAYTMKKGANSIELCIGTTSKQLYYAASDLFGNAGSSSEVSVGMFEIISAQYITETSVKITYTSAVNGTFYYNFTEAANASCDDGFAISKGSSKTYTIASVPAGLDTLYYTTDLDMYGNISIVEYIPDDTAIPTLIDANASRTSANTGKFSFTLTYSSSSKSGCYLYYGVDTSASATKESCTSIKNIASNGDSTITLASMPTADCYLHYYATDSSKKYSTSVSTIKIPAYSTSTSSAPEISNLFSTHQLSNYAYIYFTADKACTFYYSEKQSGKDAQTVENNKAGFNTVVLTINSELSKTYYVNFSSDGGKTYTYSTWQLLSVPEYSSSSAERIVTISNVVKTPATTTVGSVTVTVTAKSDVIDNPTLEYTFDGGATWGSKSTSTYSKNTTISGGQIKVRIKDDTNSANWATYGSAVVIDNIDGDNPTIVKVTRTPETETDYVKSVKITVTATDSSSGIGGYSFDGGKTWISTSYKEYTANATLAANSIQVKDKAGNITKYPSAITISNIDNTAPSITLSQLSTRSTEDVGTLYINSSEAGTLYYRISLSLTKTNSSNEYSKIDLKKGENVVTVKGLSEYGTTVVGIMCYAEDAANNKTSTVTFYIPDFTVPDTTAPVISSVKTTPEYSQTEINVVVNATDEISLDDKPYSFDGGKTWQSDNYKAYTSNTTISEKQIAVKDAAGNIAYYDAQVKITGIDKTAPTVSASYKVSGKNVIITIKATDSGSGIAKYSFDNGANWTTSASLVLNEETIKAYSAADFQAMDKAGNIGKGTTAITLKELQGALGLLWNNPYKDIKEGDWYYEYVEGVTKLGLFLGDDKGNFMPEDKMTRGMFVTVLGRLGGIGANEYNGADCKFTDVNKKEYYASYIVWAAKYNIVSTSSSTFSPDVEITREQMCVMVHNFLTNYLEASVSTTVKYNFTDEAKISSWAKNAIAGCYNIGIVSGDKEGTFRPQDSLSRAEAAVIFTRLANLLGITAE